MTTITLKIFAAVLLAVSLVASANLAAQESQSSASSQPQPAHSGSKTLTGCFFRGEAVGKYRFSSTDGLIWDAVGQTKNMKMSSYVGHTVTVRGVLKPNPNDSKVSQTKDPLKRDLAKNNGGIITITRVTHVGDTCTEQNSAAAAPAH